MNKSLLEKLLDYYHLTYDEYLSINEDKNLSNFDDGHHFDQIEEASDLVKEAIKNNDRIAIYGDYDADGIMGTSILTKMFHYLDYNVEYYIPSRYLDGYGITLKKAEEYVSKHINLVITVDNGISAFEPISYLKDNGVKVLVLDHHTPSEKLPNADYIIHPLISHFSKVSSSGAFVAFMFSRVVLGRNDKYLSELAAISLISDMMPLKEQNRYLLRTVFKDYKKGEFLPIDLLSDNEGFDESIIGMKIAPRINSIGRLIEDSSVNEIVPFFLNEDSKYVLNYFDKINSINDLRKQASKDSLNGVEFDKEEPAIVIRVNAKEGLIGLIANNILNQLHKPVVVFTNSCEDGILKGSARSIDGFNIVDAFNKCSSCLTAFGGHSLAGGCSLKEEDYETFKKQFVDIAFKTEIVETEKANIEITLNDINKENYELIKSFSPFGEEWKAPNLQIKNIKVASLFYSKTQEHIFSNIGYGSRIVGFGFSKTYMSQFSFINAFGSLRVSSFKGYDTVEFMIKKIEPSVN